MEKPMFKIERGITYEEFLTYVLDNYSEEEGKKADVSELDLKKDTGNREKIPFAKKEEYK